MTICPCCGHKSNTPLADGCAACGARPVGEALPKPERELPSYARSLVLVVTAFLIWIAFITQFGVAFAQNVPTLKTYREAFRAWLSVAAHFWVWIAAAMGVYWEHRAGPAAVAEMEKLSAIISAPAHDQAADRTDHP